jgi:hypothetical protein
VRDNVVTLPTPLNADAAWERYRRQAVRLLDDPSLSLDRAFMEQLHLADLAFRATVERLQRVG